MKTVILTILGLIIIGSATGIFLIITKASPTLKRNLSLIFRPPLESDNLNESLKLNRLLSNPLFLIIMIAVIDICAFFLFNFLFNVFKELPEMLGSLFKGTSEVDFKITAETWKMHLKDWGSITNYMYLAFVIILLIIDIKTIYMFRLSYSEKAINKGDSGTSRWTTINEIVEQYKEIELKPVNKKKETNTFKGKGGMPVARWRDKLYIDSQLTNNLFLGATRSGKGEMFVFPLIDVLSRAEKQENRPSMIIFDPKLELYKSCFETLEKRKYKVRLLNLDNPMKSAGYNPLAIIAEYYKRGRTDEAQQLAKSFAFGIFNSNADTQEPIWKNTATDLWTALILAHVTDCIDEDAKINAERVQLYGQGTQNWTDLITNNEVSKEYIEDRRKDFAQVYLSLKPEEDYLYNIDDEKIEDDDYGALINQNMPNAKPISCSDMIKNNDIFIPDYIYDDNGNKIYIGYQEINPNEQNINCFSALNFFKELVDVNSVSQEGEAGAKKAETALDDYFNQRPELDFAKMLYASIKSAGDRTKGSVYINMQSALSIFTQDNIARLTAESDIDIASLGFDKEAPTAVFIGLPTEDKSNHFIALTFVTQVFQYLWKLSKEGTNKLDREVQFILDEFGNMPVFDNFDGMVTNCLGAGMAFNIFLQSYNQLHSKYEMDMDTIKDNFANQFYILAVGQESANEFSEQLGNKTIIELQRSGTLLSTKKSIMENPKERPLLFPAELQNFKQGETALIRASKRTDRAGAGIGSYPIYDEYQMNMYFWWNIIIFIQKIVIKRWIKHDYMKDRDTKEELTSKQEYKYWISEKQRWQGTAFLYRYQYATDAFPNPTDINFNEIFKEKGRESIDYQSMVMNTNKVLNRLKQKPTIDPKEKMSEITIQIHRENKTKEWATYTNLCNMYIGVGFENNLGISKSMTLRKAIKIVEKYVENLNEDDERKIRIEKDGFKGQLNKLLR